MSDKILITRRRTLIGDEYTASYGPISAVATGHRQYAIDALVAKLEFASRNWIVGKSVDIVEVEDES